MNNATKTYSTKATAVRGATRQGLKADSYTVEPQGDKFVLKLKGSKGRTKLVIPMLRASTIVRPTKKVWHIADEMKGATRQQVIAECVKRGIAFYTARTQYQSWKSTAK